jgi:hypothetical protein
MNPSDIEAYRATFRGVALVEVEVHCIAACKEHLVAKVSATVALVNAKIPH